MVRVTDQDNGPDPAEPPDDAPTADAGGVARQHPVVVYTLLRLTMLAAVGLVLYLVGLRDIWLLLLAFLVSGVLSAFLLTRPREGAALGITSAFRGINARIDASTRAEDDDADDGSAPPPSP